jgi:hypothetical protein
LWNGKEVVSFDDLEIAILDLFTDLREQGVEDRFWFYSSPLIVSGVLAIGLLILIAVLSFYPHGVPAQLWTIFTAIVAFYFGKQGFTASRGNKDANA